LAMVIRLLCDADPRLAGDLDGASASGPCACGCTGRAWCRSSRRVAGAGRSGGLVVGLPCSALARVLQDVGAPKGSKRCERRRDDEPRLAPIVC
jgi:hypothetical protein